MYKILGALSIFASFFIWSCGGGSSSGGGDTGGGNTGTADTTGNVVNNCVGGSTAFAAINTVADSSCLGCHGGDNAGAVAALDWSSTDTLTRRGNLSLANRLDSQSNANNLSDYLTSSSHPGSGSVPAGFDSLLSAWFTAELSCINAESGSSSNSGSVGSRFE